MFHNESWGTFVYNLWLLCFSVAVEKKQKSWLFSRWGGLEPFVLEEYFEEKRAVQVGEDDIALYVSGIFL